MSKRIRETSKQAYDRIVAGGLLSTMRLFTYKELYKHGPMTAGELEESTGGRRHEHKRLSELRDLGVVQELGTRKCNVTGVEAIEWDVTDRLPCGRVRRSKTRVEVVVNSCDGCLFQDVSTCMAAPEGTRVKCLVTPELPIDCPLHKVSYVIRGA